MSMMDCLDYIQEGSNASSPAAKCCDELKSVVSTSPGCLCEGFKMASDLGIKIDMARALKMPQACSVPLPPGAGNCTGMLFSLVEFNSVHNFILNFRLE